MSPTAGTPSGRTSAAGGAASAAVRIVIDAQDDAAWTSAALHAHAPGRGRLVLHPSPGASAPPALAQDLLGALGKQLPPHDPNTPRHRATWVDMVQPAWPAAACWIHAHRIGHLIVLRAHTLTPTRWGQLDTLRRRTGIHLTLVWHHKIDARLRERTAQLSTGYQQIDTLSAARAVLERKGPTRPGTAQHTANGPGTRSGEPELTDRVQRIGHPLHAALLATQTLVPHAQAGQLAATRLADLAPDATALALPHPPYQPTSPRHWHPLPAWAQPLLTAARAWHYLTGHHHPSRHLFQHTNFHHHNQLSDLAALFGITPAIDTLTGDPAWPTHTDTP